MPADPVLAYYTWALKEVVDPFIRDSATKKTVFLDELERSSEFTVDTPYGRRFYVPILLGLPQGHNTTDEYGPLPEAGRSTGEGAVWYPRQVTCRVGWSFRAQNIGGSKEAVWQAIPAMEMENAVKFTRMSLNRQCFGDGSGILARCSAMSTPGNIIPVDTTKWIYAHASNGMYVDIVDVASGTKLAEKRMATAKTAASITISGTAVQTTADHAVVMYGSYNSEITGVGKIIGTGALAGVDPTTPGYEEWQGVIIDASNAGPSVPLFEQAFQAIDDANGEISWIVVGSGVYRAAAAHLTSYKRIPVESSTITLPGGQKGIDWNGRALVRDKDCPSGTAIFVDTDVLKFAQIDDGGWQDLGGDIIHWDGGRGYTAIWIWDVNMVCHARNRLAKIINIAEA
ncbi:MAG: phage major capsid protein [Armatimonadota bacterium]